jgi:hypothetical protein
MTLSTLDETKKYLPLDVKQCQEDIKNLQAKYDVHTYQLSMINRAMDKIGLMVGNKIPALLRPKI